MCSGVQPIRYVDTYRELVTEMPEARMGENLTKMLGLRAVSCWLSLHVHAFVICNKLSYETLFPKEYVSKAGCER